VPYSTNKQKGRPAGGLDYEAVVVGENNHRVTPAQAGAHPEMVEGGETSGWIPAYAGMTPRGSVER
jgi:hypothetical protein